MTNDGKTAHCPASLVQSSNVQSCILSALSRRYDHSAIWHVDELTCYLLRDAYAPYNVGLLNGILTGDNELLTSLHNATSVRSLQRRSSDVSLSALSLGVSMHRNAPYRDNKCQSL